MKQLLALIITLVSITPAFGQLAVPNAAGLTYGHVHLNVSDIELHKKLWVEHFDGVVVQKGPLTAIRLPNMLVALAAREPSGGSRGTVMDHFGFKVRNMETFLAKWRTTGYEVGSEFIGAEGQKNAYVMMPDDIYVELQEDQALHVEIMAYHIHFFTDQYKELLQWYTDIFSLEERPRGRITTTTNAPGMNLSFSNSDSPRAATRGAAIDHIGFEFEDLEAFCKELEAKGIEFAVPFREIPAIGLKTAFITDPAGVYIELTEGYDAF
ncbi:MAG: VOC family protein [Gammaproteobacteria bacterium]|nr:VOC family protein [Gammaproteobacteria bacterium]